MLEGAPGAHALMLELAPGASRGVGKQERTAAVIVVDVAAYAAAVNATLPLLPLHQGQLTCTRTPQRHTPLSLPQQASSAVESAVTCAAPAAAAVKIAAASTAAPAAAAAAAQHLGCLYLCGCGCVCVRVCACATRRA